MRISYEKRIELSDNKLLKKLFRIIIEKKSNLCIAANFLKFEDIVKFIDAVGKHVCIIKIQYMSDNSMKECEKLEILNKKKKEHNFLLFVDEKFSDGYKPIYDYYANRFVKYADLVTVNCEDGVLDAIEDAARNANLPEDEPRGCLALCELSFTDSGNDTNRLLQIAEKHSNICCGIIAQRAQVPDPYKTFKASPGVHIGRQGDGHQRWRHPSEVIRDGADVVIVGRGITEESDWEKAAILYKETSYQAYLDQLQ